MIESKARIDSAQGFLLMHDADRRIVSLDDEANRSEPLYCFAISAKRHALFNRTEENRPEVLAQYHLSSEAKFLNAQFRDRGRTERRHVVATGQVWIGKEANQVGESGEADPIWSAVEKFATDFAPAKTADRA